MAASRHAIWKKAIFWRNHAVCNIYSGPKSWPKKECDGVTKSRFGPKSWPNKECDGVTFSVFTAFEQVFDLIAVFEQFLVTFQKVDPIRGCRKLWHHQDCADSNSLLQRSGTAKPTEAGKHLCRFKQLCYNLAWWQHRQKGRSPPEWNSSQSHKERNSPNSSATE